MKLCFCFVSSFYSNSRWLAYRVMLVSRVEFSDSSLTYNTQCSSRQVPSLMPITHLAHPPSPLSLFSIVKNLLWFASLFFFPLPYIHLFCFLNSTYERNHMVFVFLCEGVFDRLLVQSSLHQAEAEKWIQGPISMGNTKLREMWNFIS